MEKAKQIWEELNLPKLTPRPPWSGYSLGHWSEEASVQADNATAGHFELNAQFSAAKGVKVPKGTSFVEMKKKFLANELDETKKEAKR